MRRRYVALRAAGRGTGGTRSCGRSARRCSRTSRGATSRPGGDEFAVLLQQTPLGGARALAEQIRAAVSAGRIRRADSKEQPGSVTLSIGVAAGGSDDTLESLLARADAAATR